MDWDAFNGLILYAAAGWLFHLLTKLANARMRKPNFKFSIFFDRNAFQFFASAVAVLISVAVIANHLTEMADPLTGVAIGYGGSSFLKNLLKQKEPKQNGG
nr:hypothetical protein 13 [bacterium]